MGGYMGRPGLEPGTNRLKAEYSTIELATHKIFVFCLSTQLLILARFYFFWQPFLKKNFYKKLAMSLTIVVVLAPGSK